MEALMTRAARTLAVAVQAVVERKAQTHDAQRGQAEQLQAQVVLVLGVAEAPVGRHVCACTSTPQGELLAKLP